MATHSSILAWEIPWKEEPGRLQSMGLERAGHDLATKQENIPLYRLIPSLILWLYLMNKYEINAFIQFSSVQSPSCVRLFVTPWNAGRQAPCPSPTPRVYPNPCPLSWWCHSTISSSVVPFSSCPQSYPASWSFQMSQLSSYQVAKVLEFQLQHQSLQWSSRTDLL